MAQNVNSRKNCGSFSMFSKQTRAVNLFAEVLFAANISILNENINGKKRCSQ